MDNKEWKERGVGDIKILHHPQKKTYRILLRRDQIHKIACNHYINTDQKLEPMQRYVNIQCSPRCVQTKYLEHS